MELILTSQHSNQAAMDALNTMSLTALTVSAGQTWPFVSLTDFAVWTNRFSIGARAVTLVVLADEKDRKAWPDYSKANYSSWAGAGDPMKKFVPYIWKNLESDNSTSLPTSSWTKESIVEDDSEGVAAISWQSTPVDPQAVNFNQLSSPLLHSVFDLMNATKQPVQWSTSEMPGSTFIMQPIMPNDSEMLGYLMAQISLLSYFDGGMDLQKMETPGLVFIVKDVCRDLAVQLDLYFGREARLVNSARLTHLAFHSTFKMEAPLLLSVAGEGGTCSAPLVLQVFANQHFAGLGGQAASRLQPSKLAIATGVFVVFLGAICFLLYDFWARRKQARLANSAKKSLAIVNALFPATVRDRLLEKEDTKSYPINRSVILKRASTGGGKKSAQPANKIQSRITNAFQSMAESIALGNDSMSEDIATRENRSASSSTLGNIRRRMASKPIADLFPEVSVLFADICGYVFARSIPFAFLPASFSFILLLFDSTDSQLGAPCENLPRSSHYWSRFSRHSMPLRNVREFSKSRPLAIAMWQLLDFPILAPITPL